MKKTSASTDPLRQLLCQIAPSEEAASDALERIVRAIEIYYAHKPHRDEQGVRRRGSVSKTRKSLADLEKVLDAAFAAVKDLPLEAIPLFYKAYGGPRGALVETLKKARSAASEARMRGQELPDKVPDTARRLLAWDVARVFEEVLKRKPTATRDVAGQVEYAKGGAAYARVLRATFGIAGLDSVDIGPDIDAGLRLLREGPTS